MDLAILTHGNDVDAVFCADIQLPDALAAPFGRRLQLGDAAVGRKLDKIQNARRGQRLRQLDAGLTLRHDDAVGPDLLKRAALRLVGGLAHDGLHAEFLEVQRRHDAGGQIAADGDDGAVIIARTERAQRVFIPRVADGRAGDLAFHFLHELRVQVHSHDLAAELVQPLRDRGAEAAEADDQICFFHCIILISISRS